MKPAIKIENLSKQYRLGLVGTGTLSHDLKRWWHLIRGKEDPYLKIGETNQINLKSQISNLKSEKYVWALKDINLEVMPGEVLGIIGKNGAGKSTLLKILSKVTGPTTGKIDYKGRIGSLLEVGTGFHPELTGRENIYLNGAILGMRKKEIDRKFDEIVDFSGVERYIDTPVKRYSSGMTVRLGFAVAAFLEPEILVVDEVLAVGDAEFQKKAIGKMQDVSKNEGRTVLFVSHNMASIKLICSKSILLKNGQIDEIGHTDLIIKKYQTINKSNPVRTGLKNLNLRKLTILNKNDNPVEFFNTYDSLKFELEYDVLEELNNVSFAICFNNVLNWRITSLWSSFKNDFFNLKPGKFTLVFSVNSIQLTPGEYEIIVYAESLGIVLERIDNYQKIDVGFGNNETYIQIPTTNHGVYVENFNCKIK